MIAHTLIGSVPDPNTTARLYDWLSSAASEAIEDACWLINLETPSDDVKGLEVALSDALDWLDQRIPGLRRVHHQPSSDDSGPCQVLELPGSRRVVTLLCHIDTVFSAGTVERRPASVEGDHLKGPGCFDMKVGCVQAVWAVRALIEAGLPLPTIRMVFNTDEETGSRNSRETIEQACAGSEAVLVFEAAAGGRVKTSRKGVALYNASVSGVEAHSGLDPKDGVNAIHELAQLIVQVCALADPELGTTVNVGTIVGGTRTNVSAGQATSGIEVRASSQAELERVHREIMGLHCRDPRATITVSGGLNRPVMERSSEIAAVFARAQAISRQLGLDLGEAGVGGASDGSFAAVMGLPLLDGLGATGDGAHTEQEYVSISEVPRRTALAAALIASFA